MSGGGKGGGSSTTTTQQVFNPTEQAARDKVFAAGEQAFDAQSQAIQGGTPGTPGTPAVYGPDIPATYADQVIRGRTYQGAQLTPAQQGQLITPATEGIPGTAGPASSATPAGNQNPAAAPVPFDPYTLQSQEQLLQFALGQGQEGVNSVQAGLNYGLNVAPDPNNNPALDDLLNSANRRLTQQFTDPGGALSQIRGQSIADGQLGSSRQGIAEGIAGGRFAEILGDTSAQIINNAYNTGQDTFARTLALAPQSLQTGVNTATQLGAIGAQNENLAQLQEQYAASGRQFDLNAPFVPVQNYANIVNGTVAPGSVTTGQPSRASGGGIGGILSGGLGGALSGASVGGLPGGIIGGGIGILGSLFS